MIVDIEQLCILKGAILFQLFQGQKVMQVDFLRSPHCLLHPTCTPGDPYRTHPHAHPLFLYLEEHLRQIVLPG